MRPESQRRVSRGARESSKQQDKEGDDMAGYVIADVEILCGALLRF
jgi:hypothetical protein